MRLPRPMPLRRRCQQGSLLVEVSLAFGFAVLLALLLMKGSLLAIGGNQWTILQTLTDAYLTREVALAQRIPVADITSTTPLWPDPATDSPARSQQTVTIGRLPGGTEFRGELTRFRINETDASDTDTGLAVWRLHSVLTYTVGQKQYVKSRSTLRMQ